MKCGSTSFWVFETGRQQLERWLSNRGLILLVKDWVWSPLRWYHFRWLTATWKSSCRGSDTAFWPPQSPAHTQGTHVHPGTHMNWIVPTMYQGSQLNLGTLPMFMLVLTVMPNSWDPQEDHQGSRIWCKHKGVYLWSQSSLTQQGRRATARLRVSGFIKGKNRKWGCLCLDILWLGKNAWGMGQTARGVSKFKKRITELGIDFPTDWSATSLSAVDSIGNIHLVDGCSLNWDFPVPGRVGNWRTVTVPLSLTLYCTSGQHPSDWSSLQ